MSKPLKLVFNTIYSIGVICVLALGAILIFIPNKYAHPDAMVPIGVSALLWLIIGTIPMVAACVTVYIVNNIKNTKHKIRNTILIFTPGFICLSCFLFMIFGTLYTKYFS